MSVYKVQVKMKYADRIQKQIETYMLNDYSEALNKYVQEISIRAADSQFLVCRIEIALIVGAIRRYSTIIVTERSIA